MIITGETKLCDIVINDPSSITVLNRFDIYLGVGDKTVAEICGEKKLDTVFFITILNTYLNEDYFPEKVLKTFSVNIISKYFNKTNEYYQRLLIPNIERHFDVLVTRSMNGNNNLVLLREFFNEVKNELNARIVYDNEHLLKCNERQLPINAELTELEKNDLIEDKLSDLINMFVIHLKGEYDINLCQAVLTSFISFQKDIRQNNRIRYRILLPLLSTIN